MDTEFVDIDTDVVSYCARTEFKCDLQSLTFLRSYTPTADQF